MAEAREAMRRRREELGFTQEALAESLGIATTTYREWERGVKTPRVGFRPRLARRLDVSLGEVARMLDGDGRAMAPDGVAVPEWLGHFAALEQGAAELWTFEPVVVPGLLQTEAYAIAVEQLGPEPVSDAAVAEKVAMRMARQEVLARDGSPLALRAVVDESVLRRSAGGPAVMGEQLRHLAATADRPTIELRVLPLDAGVFSASFGGFHVITSIGRSAPHMVCVRDRVGPHYLERSHDVAAHVRLFEYLLDVALTPAETVERIRTITRESPA